MDAQRLLPSLHSRRAPSRGRRSFTEAVGHSGHSVRAVKPAARPVQDVAILATLQAATRRHLLLSPPAYEGRWEGIRILASDLRIHLRRARTGTLILFVVDASGSMAARKRMAAVKGAVLGLLLDAYQKRDRVGLIAFRGEDADLLVPPTNSVEMAERRLRHLPTGRRTPLAAGLLMANQVIVRQQRQNATLVPLLVLVTDGRSNTGPLPEPVAREIAVQDIPALVLDSEQGFVKMGQARQLAHWLNALYVPLDRLTAGEIQQTVRRFRRR